MSFHRLFAAVLPTVAVPVFLGTLPPGPVWGDESKVVKFVRFQVADETQYGLLEGDRVRRITGQPFGPWSPTDATWPLDRVKLLVPVRPTKILAAAGNYKSHLGDTAPHTNPEFFFKPPSCLIASGEKIVLPKGTERVDFEGELVVVIGKRAKDVPPEKAADYVLGFTCGNDVSARDWQKNDVQWWRAKGTDTFGPCGPAVVAGVPPDNLLLRTRVNGRVVQEQRTSELIHNVAQMVSFASRHVTLEPGDLIYTGTPGTTSPLAPGDLVEVEIEGIGVLRNEVVKQ